MTYEKFKIDMVKQGVDVKKLTKFMLKYSITVIGVTIGIFLTVNSCIRNFKVLSYISIGLMLLLYLSSFPAFVENKGIYDRVELLLNKYWLISTVLPAIVGVVLKVFL